MVVSHWRKAQSFVFADRIHPSFFCIDRTASLKIWGLQIWILCGNTLRHIYTMFSIRSLLSSLAMSTSLSSHSLQLVISIYIKRWSDQGAFTGDFKYFHPPGNETIWSPLVWWEEYQIELWRFLNPFDLSWFDLICSDFTNMFYNNLQLHISKHIGKLINWQGQIKKLSFRLKCTFFFIFWRIWRGRLLNT